MNTELIRLGGSCAITLGDILHLQFVFKTLHTLTVPTIYFYFQIFYFQILNHNRKQDFKVSNIVSTT